MADIYIGTSGYSYDDWIGPVYPPDLPKSEFLSYYAQLFDAVEINYTYYSMPNLYTMRALAAKVPADFKFSVKAHRSMTHEREAGEEEFAAFCEALQPLVAEGKLGCVLAQFPWSFKPDEEAASWLRRLREGLGELPCVVEFRNRRWVHPQTYELLRELDFGFCCVDEPDLRGLMPRIAVATSSIGYVRFHGRNREKWWNHTEPWERYDYLYSRSELAEWVGKIRRLAEQTEVVFAFFNNHYQGKAVQSAQLFAEMLREAGLI